MKKIIIFVIISLLITSFSFGKTFRKVGTSAAQFLKIGVGARALSLSGAYGAISDDANATYWNPAGIATVNNISWTGTHTNWFADISHQFTALVLPVGNGSTLGFSATFVTMDEEEITTETNPQGTDYYWNASDIAVGLSYARWMTDRFALGLTVKYVSQKIWHENASTFAVDIGTYLKTGFKGIIIGMSFSNFGGSLQLQGRDLIREYDPNPDNTLNANVDTRLHTEPWPLPVNFRVGIAVDVVGMGNKFVTSENNRFTLAIDGTHPNDDREKLNFGLEYCWQELLFARFGYGLGYDLVEFTYGAGLRFEISGATFVCDYALAPYGDLDHVHHYTIGLEF